MQKEISEDLKEVKSKVNDLLFGFKMTYKIKLKIINVSPVEYFGDNRIPMLKFTATPDNENTFDYQIFGKAALFPFIKADAVIEADVDISTKGTWTNRKVMQIYENGQPVNRKGKDTGAEIKARAQNTAVMATVELIKSGVIDKEEFEVWYSRIMKCTEGEPVKQGQKTIDHENITERFPDIKNYSFTDKTKPQRKESPVRNLGDLLTLANNVGYKRKDVLTVAQEIITSHKVNQVEDITGNELVQVWNEISKRKK